MLLFSTSWCPSCRAARQFFQTRRIRFAERDVEKDPEAAGQYQAIVKQLKLRSGVVPLIVANGRAFQGFNQQQIEAALAAAPPKE